MFDQMKTMGALAGLLKNREQLAEAGARVKQTLHDNPAIGEAGGGAIRVTVGSEMKVTDIEIAPAVVAGLGAGEAALAQVETLLVEATNDALTRAQQRLREALEREAKDLGIEGLGDQLGGLLS
ncbi:hypothetical protein MNBD_PLANCTO03-357 [hydrothermal vent metagenome]|uniref:Nucleoid-associated protein YaaK n=1 Tax=hydrothermal vent metagenome TaxID=652676 RepID=A0A3B1DLN8_9ZZZZ